MSRWTVPSSSGRAVMERLECRRLLTTVLLTRAAESDLVSDGPVPALHQDANLMNPWGVAITSGGDVYIANNVPGVSTAYSQAGTPRPSVAAPLAISVPAAAGSLSSTPAAVVFHSGSGFKISSNGTTAASALIYGTQDGLIAGYASSVDSTHAITAIDHSATSDAFTGMTILGSRLYAADFHNARIEVFDSGFKQVALKRGAFIDPQVPQGFAPFNIQAISGRLYVTYAAQGADGRNPSNAPANGILDIFDKAGHLKQRVYTGGLLNSPWGMTRLPSGWGKISGFIAVGNFGDGTIQLFDKKGVYVGPLTSNITNTDVIIDGLWGLVTGVSHNHRQVYFTAGQQNGTHGLFGSLTPVLKRVKIGK